MDHTSKTNAAPALATLAEFACGLSVDTLPEEVRQRAKLCLTDALDNCLAGIDNSRTGQALASVEADKGGGCVVFGLSNRAAAPDVAFVNGVSGGSASRNDTHVASGSHPGSVVIPAVLAVAELTGGSGRDVLAGIVAGYETIARVGVAVRASERGALFRPTALSGAVGAAIAASRTMRLPVGAVAAAGALACHSSFGLNEWAAAGSGEDVFQNGWAARNGVSAALLAKAGAQGAPLALEGKAGLLEAFGTRDRQALLTADLGRVFEILDLEFKPGGACLHVLAPSQVAAHLANTHDLAAEAIAHITVGVSRRALDYPGCANPDAVRSYYEAIMSIRFSVAAAIVLRRVADGNWKRIGDQAIDELTGRIDLTEDSRFTQAVPPRGVTIRVELTDGRVVEAMATDIVPPTSGELAEKLRERVVEHFGADAAGRMMASIDTMESVTDARAFCRMLSRSRA